jgi:hypothetical protein
MNERGRLVTRAQRAIRQSPDTRAIKRELEQGNSYVLRFLRGRGLDYVNGSIVRRSK